MNFEGTKLKVPLLQVLQNFGKELQHSHISKNSKQAPYQVFRVPRNDVAKLL